MLIDKSYIGKKAKILIDLPNGSIFHKDEIVILESLMNDNNSGKFAKLLVPSDDYSQARYVEFKHCSFEYYSVYEPVIVKSRFELINF